MMQVAERTGTPAAAPAEEVFRYGDGAAGMGMVSLPPVLDGAPVVVLFNAGLVQREGPYRLNVLLGRRLAATGYIVLRVDLANKGDTPTRGGVDNRTSVATDWVGIRAALEARFGERILLLGGLCSGADNAIKLAVGDDRVRGLILLDPLVPKDEGFDARRFRQRWGNVRFWQALPRRLLRRLLRLLRIEPAAPAPLDLRDAPTLDELRQVLARLAAADGRLICVFTSYSLDYYNGPGQMQKALALDGLAAVCEELYWPEVSHIYPMQQHRERLVEAIASWGRNEREAICGRDPA